MIKKSFAAILCVVLAAGCEDHAQKLTTEGNSSVRIDTVAALSIGTEGLAEFEFSNVLDARRLADGRIIVIDGGSKQIRVFDGRGRIASVSGRTGSGPGEFQSLTWAGITADGMIYAYDRSLRRISEWNANGKQTGSWNLELGENVWNPVLVLDRRSILFSEWTVPTEEQYPVGTLLRDTFSYYLVPVKLSRFVSSGKVIPTDTAFVTKIPGPFRFSNHIGRVWAAHDVPFSPTPQIVALGDTLYFTSGDSASITILSIPNHHIRSVKAGLATETVSAQDVEEMVEFKSGNSLDERGRSFRPPGSERFWSRLYAAMPRLDHKPAISGIAVDPWGNLWLGEYPKAVGQWATKWTALDKTGQITGSVSFHPTGRITHIDNKYAVVVVRDEFDVETIKLFPIRRS